MQKQGLIAMDLEVKLRYFIQLIRISTNQLICWIIYFQIRFCMDDQ